MGNTAINGGFLDLRHRLHGRRPGPLMPQLPCARSAWTLVTLVGQMAGNSPQGIMGSGMIINSQCSYGSFPRNRYEKKPVSFWFALNHL